MNASEKKMVLLIGIQASGKSSFYRDHLSDMVHISLDNLKTRNREKRRIEEAINKGLSLVIDNTNPTRKDRKPYILLGKANGYMVWGYYLRSSITDSIARNELREGKARIPRNAIAHTHRVLELPDYTEGFDQLFYVQLGENGFVVEPWADEETQNGI